VASTSVPESATQEFKRVGRRTESRVSQEVKEREGSSLPEAATTTSSPVPEPETQGLTRAQVLKAWKNQHGKCLIRLKIKRTLTYISNSVQARSR
jgi:hypothetical protein